MHDRTNDPAAAAEARRTERPDRDVERDVAGLGIVVDQAAGAMTIRRHPDMDAATWRRFRDGVVALLEAEGYVQRASR